MLTRPDKKVSDPDADLIPRLAAGDDSALSELINRRVHTIHALAARLLGDPSRAEDVVQTVFLKTWQIAPKWQYGKARLLTWMCRIATHQCLDILKKKSPLFTDVLPEQIDERNDGLVSLLAKDEAARVKGVIEALPANQRAAIILTYYQHLPQKDAADILAVSLKAFEALLSRAKKTMKHALSIEDD